MAHVSRKHSVGQVASACSVSGDNPSIPDAVDGDHGGKHNAEFAEVGECSSSKVDGDVFMNLALFYLRMQAKMLLPATTISALIGEFQELHTNVMAPKKWMLASEGKVIIEPSHLQLDFISVLVVLLFGSFYVFITEYQEETASTLELIWR